MKNINEIRTVIESGDLENFRSSLTDRHGMNIALGVAKWGNREHAKILVESGSEYLDILFTSAFRYNRSICQEMLSLGYKPKRYLNLFLLEEFIKENRLDLVSGVVEFVGDELVKSPTSGIRSHISWCMENPEYEEVVRFLIKVGYRPTESDLFQSIKSKNHKMFLTVLEGCDRDFREFHKEIHGNFGIDVNNMSKEDLVNNLTILSIHHE